MPAYKIYTGTNTAGSWHAELRRDFDDWHERRFARAGFERQSIGVVNGYGIDEAGAVADAIAKAGAIEGARP
jgi:hypothetical protein